MASDGAEAQSSHKSWDEPVKLNIALMQGGLLHLSAKKMTQRQLFAPRGNVIKEVQNRTLARKTLSVVPRHGPSSVRRPSETYKATFIKPKILANGRRPSVGQGQHLGNGCNSKLYHRKTQGPIAPPGSVINTQKISAISTKAGGSKIPAVRSQNQSRSVTAIPSRQTKVNGKGTGHIPRLENLENTLSLLNVDDLEEKLVKESSVLKSQILMQIHENTGGVMSCDVRNEQKILKEQIAISEKLKNMEEQLKNIDEKMDKLTSFEEIIKNMSSNRETVSSCSCHCHTTNAAVTKSSGSMATNNMKHTVIQATSDEQCSDTNNCVPDTENKTYSLRRSLRLNNKDAQYAYESLRKSTKLLTTPRHGSAKKTNTPGRISRKVIAQLNELYDD